MRTIKFRLWSTLTKKNEPNRVIRTVEDEIKDIVAPLELEIERLKSKLRQCEIIATTALNVKVEHRSYAYLVASILSAIEEE